jgi:methylglutaconyl-CoA hydratase
MSYTFLTVRRDGPVERVSLNRPEVRNAFNDVVIDELTRWAHSAAQGRRPRVAVLDGAGKAFCAGADLAWMSKMIGYSREENLRDANQLAHMFTALDTLPFPLIGRVHGAALGGGCGLVAVCDLVAADDETVFGFTEVKLGIVPAVVSPCVLAKIGRSAARELFLSGARFSASRALAIGLVHAVVPADALDAKVNEYIAEILGAGPDAIASAKDLIRTVWGLPAEDAAARTAEIIAARRVSAEGQEGLHAFLEKRAASWRTE